MKGWLATRRYQRYVDDFAEFNGRPSAKRIQKAHNRQLHTWLASEDLHPVARSMARSEMRAREAWRGPARWSLVISAAALLISILSMSRTF